jgi:hypothetical protein
MAENLTTGVTRCIAQENVSTTRKTLGRAPQIVKKIGASNPVNWYKKVHKWGKDVGMP